MGSAIDDRWNVAFVVGDVVVVIVVHVVDDPRKIGYWWCWAPSGGGVKAFSCQTQLLSWVYIELGLWQLELKKIGIRNISCMSLYDKTATPVLSSLW